MENLIDQENRPLGGGPLVRRGKHSEADQPPLRPRTVLGEVNQNARRHTTRNYGNKPQESFSIFCDAPAPSKPLLHQTDKENVVPRAVKVGKTFDVRVQHTRTQQVLGETVQHAKAVHLLHSQVQSINTSVEAESPMVVETSVVEEVEQWRVPPIKDNHTVDIFTEPEYFQDIYRYLKQSELQHLPKWNYMAKQNDITHSMRSILVDWLVEVGEEYKLQTETLHLAVNYIDRFLSYMAVQRSKLQLVGAACMFIAAKYEEIYPPDVSEFVYITDDTYTKRQVLRMEHLVLKVLEFDLNVPTSFTFLNKMCEMDPLDQEKKEKLKSLSAYLAELSMVDGEFLKHPPSVIAAASVALGRHTLELEAWPTLLQEGTGYQLEELKDCFVSLHDRFTKAESNAQQAVREKYKTTKYFGVADLSPPTIF